MEKKINVLAEIASTLGRRDEVPNQELAKAISQSEDTKAVEELVIALSNKDKAIQNDCIKVLYEIGAIKPEMIAPYMQSFLELLHHKNNRLQWGAMTALYEISKEKPTAIFDHLPLILQATDKGSVITRDQTVNILIQLAGVPQFASDAFSLLNEQLLKCPTNQLPMYAERALPIINEKNKIQFVKTLETRLADIDKESKRKRVVKVINKFQ